MSRTGIEFAYTQAPKSMQGLLTGLFFVTSGLGGFLATGILNAVQAATTDCEFTCEGKSPWASHVECRQLVQRETHILLRCPEPHYSFSPKVSSHRHKQTRTHARTHTHTHTHLGRADTDYAIPRCFEFGLSFPSRLVAKNSHGQSQWTTT